MSFSENPPPPPYEDFDDQAPPPPPLSVFSPSSAARNNEASLPPPPPFVDSFNTQKILGGEVDNLSEVSEELNFKNKYQTLPPQKKSTAAPKSFAFGKPAPAEPSFRVKPNSPRPSGGNHFASSPRTSAERPAPQATNRRFGDDTIDNILKNRPITVDRVKMNPLMLEAQNSPLFKKQKEQNNNSIFNKPKRAASRVVNTMRKSRINNFKSLLKLQPIGRSSKEIPQRPAPAARKESMESVDVGKPTFNVQIDKDNVPQIEMTQLVKEEVNEVNMPSASHNKNTERGRGSKRKNKRRMSKLRLVHLPEENNNLYEQQPMGSQVELETEYVSPEKFMERKKVPIKQNTPMEKPSMNDISLGTLEPEEELEAPVPSVLEPAKKPRERQTIPQERRPTNVSRKSGRKTKNLTPLEERFNRNKAGHVSQSAHESNKRSSKLNSNKIDKLLWECINDFRTDPESVLSLLEERLDQFVPGTKNYEISETERIVTQEGKAAVEEAIRFMTRVKPLSPLAWSDGVAQAAKQHVIETGAAGTFTHELSDGSQPTDRVMRHLGEAEVGAVAESIKYQLKGPGEGLQGDWRNCLDNVLDLIIDDGVKSRGNRKNIFGDWDLIGVHSGSHMVTNSMCTVLFVQKKASVEGRLERTVEAIDQVLAEPRGWVQKQQRIVFNGSEVKVTNVYRMTDGSEQIVEGKKKLL
eukprot:augustus_masked-scaffold_5-processed-gene-20.20-mRNA-1 protein AED:1.00 eAED:1.00 QI:0/-1/0/0/-1/1/1/0/693